MLRVLQERSFQRVGGEEKIGCRRACDWRNQPRPRGVRGRGSLPPGLLYRINPLVIEVPPLRDRREDIPDLVSYFLKTAMGQGNGQALGVSDAALTVLQNHRWPGKCANSRTRSSGR
jgi:transcriptional regulator with PAS, ATPase and Fis domain